MGKRLNATVYVSDKDGVTHAFGPGDTVPAWAKKLITNDDVWTDADEVDASEVPAPTPPDGTDAGNS